MTTYPDDTPTEDTALARLNALYEHHGLPPLEPSKRPVSHFEFWPPSLFYLPVGVMWAALAARYLSITLPTAANPGFPLGGLVGESKSEVLSRVQGSSRDFVAPYITAQKGSSYGAPRQDLADIANKLETAKLVFPLVAKPNLGCRGVGVKVIRSDADLKAYYDAFPAGETFLLQDFVPFEGEAGIFYVRHPEETDGRLFSLTLKYFPYVFGDGRSTLKELIDADPRAGRVSHLYYDRHRAKLSEVLEEGEVLKLAFAGSHSRGAIFRNGNNFATEALRHSFDRIAKDIDGFYFGRFDIRYRSIDDLVDGRGFKIVEINGAGSEATHIWDARTRLFDAYKTLWQQYQMAFQFGDANRKNGYKQDSLSTLLGRMGRENELKHIYPLTE